MGFRHALVPWLGPEHSEDNPGMACAVIVELCRLPDSSDSALNLRYRRSIPRGAYEQVQTLMVKFDLILVRH